MSTFHPGDRVICVDATIRPQAIEEITRDVPNWVVKGHRYTVREVLDNDGIVEAVLLEEIRNRALFFRLIGRTQEPGFATWRFRKLTPSEAVYEHATKTAAV